jgi:hypothetical protein
MSLFVPLGWIDTWALACAIRRQQKDLTGEGVRTLDVLTADKTRWQPALNVVSRVRRRLREVQKIMPTLATYEVAEVEIEQFDPHTDKTWAVGWNTPEITLHVGIVTNPFSRLYCGTEVWAVGVGDVVAIDAAPAVLRSAVNHGDTARIHLVVRLRQRATEEDEN